MYVPVLQARQAERGAVVRCAELIRTSSLCIPLFRPVTPKLSDIALLARQLSVANVPYALLTTPMSRATPTQSSILSVLAAHDAAQMALPLVGIGADVELDEFQEQLALLGERPLGVFHDSDPDDPEAFSDALAEYRGRLRWHFFRADTCSDRYIATWSGNKASISDDFNRQPRNQDYAAEVDEAYSDSISNYRGSGYHAFGDYTITGDYYAKGGGRAGAVTLHLTYHINGAVRIRHFVSSKTAREDDVYEKFEDALSQLIEFIDSQPGELRFSRACGEYRRLHLLSHFPGLAAAKRLSIQHHIELMLYELGRA